MGQLRDRMVHDLELAGYVPHTRLVYVNSIRDFAAYHRRSPELLGADDVRAWIEKLKADGKIGSQRLRQHMAALKFLYTKTLWKPENVSFLSWGVSRRPRRRWRRTRGRSFEPMLRIRLAQLSAVLQKAFVEGPVSRRSTFGSIASFKKRPLIFSCSKPTPCMAYGCVCVRKPPPRASMLD